MKTNKKIHQITAQKLKSIPLRMMAPNIVTILALCAGVSSIRYGINEQWAKAIICIFLSAFFDMLDGRVARMLNASSKFGAELDSLSDFVSFGVAPAIIIYQWTLFDFPRFGWLFALIFVIAMALRLARFNTMLDDDSQESYWQNFFVGVPAPAAAALAIIPLIFSLEFPELSFLRSNWFVSIVMTTVAFLMVSKIPTISTKKLKIPAWASIPLILAIVFFAHFAITQPWLTLGIMGMIYAISIPLSCMAFRKAKMEYNKDHNKI